jgi:late competence protein required for DNA uptake (superfamily II DNA/RNA helicase)
MDKKWKCEFCGKFKVDIEGTAVTGCYCIDCHRLARAESLRAIKTLQHNAHERRLAKQKNL